MGAIFRKTATKAIPEFAPKSHNILQTLSKGDNGAIWEESSNPRASSDDKCLPRQQKQPADKMVVNWLLWLPGALVERKGVEPSTSALRTQRSPN